MVHGRPRKPDHRLSHACSQALATVSKVTKRRAGEPLTEAVIASLTSLSARGLSSGQQRINTAVDRVFEEVLSQPFVRQNLVDIDDFI